MTAGRTKSKDLNGSRKKHLAIRCSKRPWRNGERGRERTYFKQISLFRTRCIYVARRSSGVRVYISSRCSWKGLAFFSLRGVRKVSNLKGLKRFPRGWRVGLSALKHRSTDDSFFLSRSSLSLPPPNRSCPPSRLIPFRFFSLLSPYSVVTYCELLREPCRPAEKDSALSLSMRKISCDMKNGADTLAARLVSSRLVSSRHVLPESRRLSCVIITFTTRTGCRKNVGDIADRVAGNPIPTSGD